MEILDSAMASPEDSALTNLEHVLLGLYTARCCGGNGAGLGLILPEGRTRFYAYGRQALAEGFRRAGLKAGDEVLLPGFICAEVLASLAVVGAVPRFYLVDDKLCADVTSWDRANPKGARAVVAVNYFGFPQPLDLIREWCRAKGAALIEDNAQGFLSTDGETPLGRRGDLGVFSLRKTLSLPNGAALVDNRPGEMGGNGLSYEKSCGGAEWRYRFKIVLKWVMEWGGLRTVRAVLTGVRTARLAATGEAIPASPPDRESVIPQEAFAPLTSRLLLRCDFCAERARRRNLYQACRELFLGVPEIRPLFGDLPEGVVPQGFPFLYTGMDRSALIRAWWRRGVPILAWPDHLPSAVRERAPEHYHRVMLVPFLW